MFCPLKFVQILYRIYLFLFIYLFNLIYLIVSDHRDPRRGMVWTTLFSPKKNSQLWRSLETCQRVESTKVSETFESEEVCFGWTVRNVLWLIQLDSPTHHKGCSS